MVNPPDSEYGYASVGYIILGTSTAVFRINGKIQLLRFYLIITVNIWDVFGYKTLIIR
jgi:hypothetical protein